MADDKKPTLNTEEDAEETSKGKDAEVDGKKKNKAKSKAKEVKEEEEESSDEEEHPGLYDKPLVIEGKRERKKTEFLVKDPDERKKPEPLHFNGTGDALGTMEVVSHEISKCTSFELKPLHKLLFGRDGRAKEIKKNIKSFNGFRIEEGTKEYENKKFGLEKFTNEGLKRLLEIFDLEKKGTREDFKERVFTFLMNPKESGKSLKALQKKNEKKVKNAEKKAAGKGEKRKRAPSKTKKSKTTKSKDKVEEDDDEEAEDEKASDEEEEEEPEEPKKKKAKTETPSKAKSTPSKSKPKTPSKSKKEEKKETKAKKSPKSKSKPVTVKITAGKRSPKKKTSEKKTPEKKTQEKKTPEKKTPEKKTPEKTKKVVDIDESSSDDEPLSKKAKKQEPTNDDLAKTVKDLLKDADLDQITVKSVSKEVFAKYPDFDLSEKKGFIKETIYSVIAGDAE